MKTEQIVAIWNNISEKRHYFCLLRNAWRSTSTSSIFSTVCSSNIITLLSQLLLRFFNRTFCWD